MATYSGQAAAIVNYTVEAGDKEQAMDYILELVKDDFNDADAYEVANIQEVN